MMLVRNTGHSHLFQSFGIVLIPFYVLHSNAAFEKKKNSVFPSCTEWKREELCLSTYLSMWVHLVPRSTDAQEQRPWGRVECQGRGHKEQENRGAEEQESSS